MTDVLEAINRFLNMFGQLYDSITAAKDPRLEANSRALHDHCECDLFRLWKVADLELIALQKLLAL